MTAYPPTLNVPNSGYVLPQNPTATTDLGPVTGPLANTAPNALRVPLPQPSAPWPQPGLMPANTAFPDPFLPLKGILGGGLIGLPIMIGLEQLYKGMGHGHSLIERGLINLDRVLGIRQIGQAIDWVGNRLDFDRSNRALTQPAWMQRIIQFWRPSINQFYQRTLPGTVLFEHTHDYLQIIERLTRSKHASPQAQQAFQSLKQQIHQLHQQYLTQAQSIPLYHHTNASGHSLHAAEALFNNIRQQVSQHAGWSETPLTGPALTSLQQQQKTLLASFGVTENALVQAGFTPQKIQSFHRASSIKDIQNAFTTPWYKRWFSSQGQQQKVLNQQLFMVNRYQRRLMGMVERLDGMNRMFLPVYEADRVLSTSLKRQQVGAFSRFIGGLMNDVRDSLNGAFIGIKHTGGSSVQWVEKLLGFKAGQAAAKVVPWIFPMLIAGQFLGRPLEEYLKAERGDKIKSFLHKFLTEEVPLALASIIGIKVLHQFSVIKLGSWVLRKIGLGRLTTGLFAMTSKLPGIGRVTRGGLLVMAILPSYLFGSRFERRFTWLSDKLIGTPDSVKKAHDTEALQKVPAAFFNPGTPQEPLVPCPATH
ncbi:MAG: hypothetical protein U0003_03320 [Vampirovibrionales bacterium]